MDNRPKLMFVVEAMGGGVFTYITELSNELVDFYDIYIAYAVRQETPRDYSTYFDERVHLIEVKNFRKNIGVSDIKAFFELRRIAETVQPDIIHLHSSKAGILGRWAFDGKQVPLFYTPHGYSFLMSDCNKCKRIFYRLLERLSAKKTCTTISCSAGEHQETLKLTEKALCVNNGINIRQLQQAVEKVDRCEHPFMVFTLGRICSQKNPKLFNQVASAMPDTKFLWIGDGELRKELTSRNIEITGWVSRDKALQCAVNADVFLLTSLWEGLPMSLLEAMYMKKLCVVSDTIGVCDVIQDGKNGYVCRTLDEFIAGIHGNTELSQVAYQNVMEEYNTSVMAGKYHEIYRLALIIPIRK